MGAALFLGRLGTQRASEVPSALRVARRCVTTSAMRILADEDIPRPLVHCLRDASHDVDWVIERRPGTSDKDVLRWARRERRTLLTFDKDFRHQVLGSGEELPDGCILLRLTSSNADVVARRVIEVLENYPDCSRTFLVVLDHRAKARALS